MAEVTIQYTRNVLGHPEIGSRVTVERTPAVQAILNAGYAIEIPAETEPEDEDPGEHDDDPPAAPELT